MSGLPQSDWVIELPNPVTEAEAIAVADLVTKWTEHPERPLVLGYGAHLRSLADHRPTAYLSPVVAETRPESLFILNLILLVANVGVLLVLGLGALR